MRILVIAGLLVACGGESKPDPSAAVCDHYATLARRCAEDVPEGERSQLEIMSRDFCRKGMSGRHDEIFGARYRQMIECTRTIESCDGYRACQRE